MPVLLFSFSFLSTASMTMTRNMYSSIVIWIGMKIRDISSDDILSTKGALFGVAPPKRETTDRMMKEEKRKRRKRGTENSPLFRALKSLKNLFLLKTRREAKEMTEGMKRAA